MLRPVRRGHGLTWMMWLTPSNLTLLNLPSQSSVTIVLKDATDAGQDIRNPVSQTGPNGRSEKPRYMTQFINIQQATLASAIEWM
jgi:hypothetical protein